MALLHRTDLTPSKLELLTGWIFDRPWYHGPATGEVVRIGAYRFDDPAGEVGIETIFVQTGDAVVLQIPLTYRGAPLVGGEQWLIGTMQHSVLGERWVYDAVGDPVYLAAVASAALTGGVQAEQYLEIDGERVVREPTARVVGDGQFGTPTPSVPPIDAVSTRHEGATTIGDAGEFSVTVVRQFHTSGAAETNGTADTLVSDSTTSQASAVVETPSAVLSGAWTSQPEPQPLVFVTLGSPTL